MTSAKDLINWLLTLPSDQRVAIDDGGLTIIAPGSDNYFELGGYTRPVVERARMRVPRTYRNQFRESFVVNEAVVAALQAAGWEDTSWGNDTSPSFQFGDANEGEDYTWKCFVDAIDPTEREHEDDPAQFLFVKQHDDGSGYNWPCCRTFTCPMSAMQFLKTIK